MISISLWSTLVGFEHEPTWWSRCGCSTCYWYASFIIHWGKNFLREKARIGQNFGNGVWFSFPYKLDRMRRVTVEGLHNPLGRNGLMMGLNVKWLNWWKKMLELRCSFFSLRLFVWCQSHWQWQFTILSLRIHLQWSSLRQILHNRICAKGDLYSNPTVQHGLSFCSDDSGLFSFSPPTWLVWLRGKKK